MRFRELDAVRGLAAVTVVFNHCLQTFAAYNHPPINIVGAPRETLPFSILKWSPLHLFVNGPVAVFVFFALSGFVLTLLLANEPEPWGAFVARRLARIYPPFAVSVLIAAVLCAWLVDQPLDLSEWFKDSWHTAPSASLIAGHLAMLGYPPYESLDNPMWSLVIEVRVAFVFPALVVAARRRPKVTLAATILATVLADIALLHAPPWIASWLRTIRYIPLFVGGILVALHLEAIEARIAALSPRARIAAWLVTLALLAYPAANQSTLYVSGLASVAILPLVLASPRAGRFLRRPLPLYLGRISYSLYLIHLPVVLSAIYLFHGTAPLPLIVATGALAAIPAAHLLWASVERASHRLSRGLVPRRVAGSG